MENQQTKTPPIRKEDIDKLCEIPEFLRREKELKDASKRSTRETERQS